MTNRRFGTPQGEGAVAHVGDHRCADSTLPSWAVTLGEMHRDQPTASGRRHKPSELPAPQSAVILVGQAARDYQRVDALLTAHVIVILVPSLQTASSLPVPDDETTHAAAPSTAAVGDLRIDLSAHRVQRGERDLPVSERELAILALLSKEPGRVRTFAELDELQGGRWLGDAERVRSAVKRLRKKLATAGAEAKIESVRGFGFRLVSRATDPPKSISGGSEGVIASQGVALASEPVPTNRWKWRPVAVLFQTVSPLGILRRVSRARPHLPWRGLTPT
jgi:DNA-binding winged helix-turn-helix (wHTH) protein